MTVKFIATITLTGTEEVDFKFEFDDSEIKDPIERSIVERIAAASLVEVGRISEQNYSILETE